MPNTIPKAYPWDLRTATSLYFAWMHHATLSPRTTPSVQDRGCLALRSEVFSCPRFIPHLVHSLDRIISANQITDHHEGFPGHNFSKLHCPAHSHCHPHSFLFCFPTLRHLLSLLLLFLLSIILSPLTSQNTHNPSCPPSLTAVPTSS